MKLKIKSKVRFIVSISMFISIILFLLFTTINTSLSHSKTEFKSVAVISGDTLWSIAYDEKQYNEYYNNKDIRYIVNDIKLQNNLAKSYLQEGQILIIPTY